MKTIWLIRHAESQANAGLVTQNPNTIELTETGFLQSQKLLESFKAYWTEEEVPQLIVTSPFLRTKQTAKSIIDFFKIRSEEWPVEEFTYLSLEKYKNTSWLGRKPAVDEYWLRNDPEYKDDSNVESFNDFVIRVNSILNEVKVRDEQFIIIFTHSYFMKTAWWLLENGFENYCNNPKLKMKEIESFIRSNSIPNTGIMKISYTRKLHSTSEEVRFIKRISNIITVVQVTLDTIHLLES